MVTGIWEAKAGGQIQRLETALNKKRAESAVSRGKKEQDKKNNTSKVSKTLVTKVSRQLVNTTFFKLKQYTGMHSVYCHYSQEYCPLLSQFSRNSLINL